MSKPQGINRDESIAATPSPRTPERSRLFWKQIERASKDVQAWPDYLKRAFGVKP